MSGQYTTRRSMLKQLKMGKGNLDTALVHLDRVRAILNSEHPEIAKGIEGVMLAIVYVQTGIDDLYYRL